MQLIAHFTVKKNGALIKTCPLSATEVIMGRSPECMIQLDDRAVSREHAIFKIIGDQIQVENKSEFAPLSVNGQECSRMILKENDYITIGPYWIQVSLQPESVSAVNPKDEAKPLVTEELGVEPQPLEGGGPDQIDASTDKKNSQNDIADSKLETDKKEEGEVRVDFTGFTQVDAGVLSVGQDQHPQESPNVANQEATRIESLKHLLVTLTFPAGSCNYTEYQLEKDEILIGRHENCDIILNDEKASQKHAKIQRKGLFFSLKDLKTNNGTLLNGKKIEKHRIRQK